MEYNKKNVLITGGLGFIGSNLAIRLVELGANVTILDAMIPEYGCNLFNIDPIKHDVEVNFSNICDEYSISHLVKDKEYIFHLAGQVSHIKSLSNPYPDIEINIRGSTVLMEACKKYNNEAIVVRTGTRGQYGPAVELPVNEDAPTNPSGIYEISQLTAEKILYAYNMIHKIPTISLRLTNIYGPRAQMKTHHYGIANWFIRLAMEDDTINVFGDGGLKRDFLYIDDCINAILLTAKTPSSHGQIFNVGVNEATTILELVKSIIEVSGTGKWVFSPYTPERKALEPGDYCSDISKIIKYTGWTPAVSLSEGLENTIDYYRKHREQYWSMSEGN